MGVQSNRLYDLGSGIRTSEQQVRHHAGNKEPTFTHVLTPGQQCEVENHISLVSPKGVTPVVKKNSRISLVLRPQFKMSTKGPEINSEGGGTRRFGNDRKWSKGAGI
jgi:hypothetical protein